MQETYRTLQKEASIVIINYNGERFIRDLFVSLFRQTNKNFEILFVDNASTDHSIDVFREIMEEEYSEIPMTLISNKTNLGFCEGNNSGLKQCSGKYVIFLNNDTYLDENWFDELLIVMNMHQSIAICQSKLVEPKTGKLQSIGGLHGVYGKGSSSNKIISDGELISGFFYAVGASMIVRREIIERIERFDKELFNGDVDLSWRIRLMGYQIVTNPRSICYHYGGCTIAKFVLSTDHSYQIFREKLRILIKNYGSENLLKRLLMWYVVSFAYAMYLSLRNRKPHIFSWAKALRWNAVNLKGTYSLRQKVQHLRNISDSKIEKYMLPYPSEMYELRRRL